MANTMWNTRLMDVAKLIASWSKDPKRKVGAIIVDEERRILGVGYNGFPRMVYDLDERYQNEDVKLRLVVHAEANAILNAASTRGAMLYCTSFPCSDCTKLIIQCGIVIVVAPKPKTEGKWAIDAEFSKSMLYEAGVTVVDYEE